MKRLATGLADLDLILGGGLLAGSVVVLAGPPGSGKTILAQQLCFTSATPEHKALYFTTFAEPHTRLVEHLHGFPFFDPEALGSRVEYIHLGDLLRGRGTGTGGLEPLIDEVARRALDEEPVLVVIDSTKMLRDFVVDDQTLRTGLYDLTSRVAHSGAVMLLLGEYTPEELQTGAEFALADGIVHLSYQSREPVDRRTLRVVKMRGTTHLSGAHTMQITAEGFRVYPRVESFVPEEVPPEDRRVPTGIPGLDALMDGGIPHVDATLVLGTSGVGKTIAGLNFLAEGLNRGERCLYLSFQDTADQLIGKAGQFGWDFAAARASNQLMIYHVPVGELELDVVTAVIRYRLAESHTTRIVIDSLAEMVQAARESHRFPAYLRGLLGVIRAAGASLWVTSETTTFGPPEEPLVGLMFLFHNVIQLRYIERCAELGRLLNVLKMRSSRHDHGMYLCHITGNGLTLGEKLPHVTGILAWSVPRDCPNPPHDDPPAPAG